ncbi:MAG: cytosine methyltransferase [Flaviaesturariibacter sp.]|nr:cytosine methyltransferase [Flaviaesturariibacter sp.]
MTPTFLIIDLFCGAGGTTTGFSMAAHGVAKVIACVNHDPKAIESHWKNHPEVLHFEEDIRTLDLTELLQCLAINRRSYPEAKVVLWASLECTNFSKAKGGQPREADSRTLADHLHRYVDALRPDFVQIENVVEFMSWGPLDENGKPVSTKNGEDWLRWRDAMCAHGYYDEWKELNSADFGAFTSRNRLFGCFARPELPIVWPTPTHAKNPDKVSLFASLQKWRPVKEVLDFSDEGHSIFNREENMKLRPQDRKPLVDKTLARIYAGLIKYVAGLHEKAFIAKYYSGRPEGKVSSLESPAGTIRTSDGQSLVRAYMVQANGVNPPFSLERPARTLTTAGGNQSLVQAYMIQHNGRNPDGMVYPVDAPARTLTCLGGNQGLVQASFLSNACQSGSVHGVNAPSPVILASLAKTPVHLIQPQFLVKYNSMGRNGSYNPPSINEPSPAVTTQNRLFLASPCFLSHYYGTGGIHSSLEAPAPTIPTKARTAIVQAEHFIDKQYGTTSNQSVNQPAGAIVSNDKHSLIQCDMAKSHRKEKVSIHCDCGHDFESTDPEYLTLPCPACGRTIGGSVTFLSDSARSDSPAVPFVMPTGYDNMPTSQDEPLGTITAGRKWHYVVNPSHGGHATSADVPCPVIVARQDKAPLSVVMAERGAQVAIALYPDDSPMTVKIKEFMALYGIVDIKMRMLKVPELLKIQGFPEGYVLEGSQADKKKFIGNSVVPHVVRAWAEAMAARIREHVQKAA